MSDETIRLTQYSHGAGCGCKLSPGVGVQDVKQAFIDAGLEAFTTSIGSLRAAEGDGPRIFVR